MTEWQRITWVVFHTLALSYNENYKEHYITFFNTLQTIIPCRMCRNHYITNISKDGMHIEENMNSENIFNWTIDLHNKVNKMHSKKIWGHDEARSFYQKNGFSNELLKMFILEYTKTNFKKKPEKTQQLMTMIRSLAYLHPDEIKRNRLISFKERFELNRGTFKNWVSAFIIVLTQEPK